MIQVTQRNPYLNNKYPPSVSMVLHTYIFDTQDEAYQCAEEAGAFEGCHGKEDWCETYDEILFEISENELEDYAPIIDCTKKEAA